MYKAKKRRRKETGLAASGLPFHRSIPQQALSSQPAFLLGFCDPVIRAGASQQKGRIWVVGLPVAQRSGRTGVGITIAAQMAAGIVSAHILPHKASAGPRPHSGGLR